MVLIFTVAQHANTTCLPATSTIHKTKLGRRGIRCPPVSAKMALNSSLSRVLAIPHSSCSTMHLIQQGVHVGKRRAILLQKDDQSKLRSFYGRPGLVPPMLSYCWAGKMRMSQTILQSLTHLHFHGRKYSDSALVIASKLSGVGCNCQITHILPTPACGMLCYMAY